MTRERRRSITLLVALVLRPRCEEHNFESTGGLWRPRLGFFGLLASVWGTLDLYN